jgi:hypothetical protein
MSDIVERLRKKVILVHAMGADEEYPDTLAREAADEIERLRGLLRECYDLIVDGDSRWEIRWMSPEDSYQDPTAASRAGDLGRRVEAAISNTPTE